MGCAGSPHPRTTSPQGRARASLEGPTCCPEWDSMGAADGCSLGRPAGPVSILPNFPSGTTSVTASMGVAVTNCTPDLTVETVLQHADAALYRAKRAGRNCVEAFSLTIQYSGNS